MRSQSDHSAYVHIATKLFPGNRCSNFIKLNIEPVDILPMTLFNL